MNDEIKAKLQEPFPEKEIEWRVGSTTADKTKGMAMAYVTNRAIQNRLDEVFGVFGWHNEFKTWGSNSQLCGISVKDHETGEWITKWDGAENTDFEATKGGLSDSMKRAAYQWGIGRYLYNLDSVWVQIKQQGKSYLIEKGCIPKLPSWALPTPEPKDSFITPEQQKEIIDLCVKEWGKDASKNFTTLTGLKSTKDVLTSQLEKIKKSITLSVVEI